MKRRKDFLVIVILAVRVHPVTKASDIHEPPIFFLYALVEFLSSMHDRNFSYYAMLCKIS